MVKQTHVSSTRVYRRIARKKGRRLVVLAAWQGIKVNERAGATYYFSPLGFYPPSRALVIPPCPPPNLRLVLVRPGPTGHTLSVSFSPKSDRRRPPEEGGRRKWRRSREEDGGSTKCKEREEDTPSAKKRGRRGVEEGSAKVLKRREKWQTLSCHEALDVFILPQAVLQERSLRCSPRPSARARARAGGFTKSFKFIYVTPCLEGRRLRSDGRFAADPSPRNSRNRIPVARFSRKFRRKLDYRP